MLIVIGDLVEDVVAWRAGTAAGAEVSAGTGLEAATDNAARITRSRGGSGANVAAAAARVVPTRFIGRVGADARGDWLVETLAEAGVEVRVQRGGTSGTVIVLVDADGERTFVTDRGAAADLEPIEADWLDGVECLHLPLYGLVDAGSRGACVAAAAEARRRGALVSVDLSSVAAIRAVGVTGLHALLAELHAEVVLANAAEAQCAALDAFTPAAGVAVVIKHGADPVELRLDGRRVELPVPPIADVRDTTGAGDAFAAGYLAARIAGRSHEECASAGVALASRALGLPGAALN